MNTKLHNTGRNRKYIFRNIVLDLIALKNTKNFAKYPVYLNTCVGGSLVIPPTSWVVCFNQSPEDCFAKVMLGT